VNTVDASTILKEAWSLWTGEPWDTSAPGGTDFANLRGWLQARVREAWAYAFWPDTIRTEKRYFAEVWATQVPLLTNDGKFVVDNNGDRVYVTRTYAAGDTVYFPSSGKYYQSLQDTNYNHQPATFTGGVWVENSAWWAEALKVYEAADWEASTSYVAGDKVYNIEDDTYYQCHTAHTSGASFADTNWGALESFQRLIEYNQPGETRIHKIVELWDQDPRIYGSAARVDHSLTHEGITTVREVHVVWAEFKVAPPVIRGDVYVSTDTYAVSEQVYYTKTDGAGNFYTCVSAAATTENPEDYAIRWSVIEIPDYFWHFLVYAVVADALRSDGQIDKAGQYEDEAYSRLADSAWGLVSQQLQTRRTEVWTR
jgi:signal peptidase I